MLEERNQDYKSNQTLFDEIKGQQIEGSIFIGQDSSSIDEILLNPMIRYYNPDSLFPFKQGDIQYIDSLINIVQKVTQQLVNLHAFVLINVLMIRIINYGSLVRHLLKLPNELEFLHNLFILYKIEFQSDNNVSVNNHTMKSGSPSGSKCYNQCQKCQITGTTCKQCDSSLNRALDEGTQLKTFNDSSTYDSIILIILYALALLKKNGFRKVELKNNIFNNWNYIRVKKDQQFLNACANKWIHWPQSQ